MPEVTLVDALNLALARALADDPDVVVFGEDVGVNGGVFRATAGLQQRFGAKRVFDTPLSEALIGGLCVGMAAQGLKPVGEIQFLGFLYPCIDQLVNHASRLRNRTQGRLSCPMVLRTPHGAGIRAPEHHSEATEAMLRQFNDSAGEELITLKIGAHVGPCLAVTLNGRLDYFGQTVNLAARVQSLAAENEICLSDEMYSLTGAADLLAAMQSNVQTVHVKGIAREIVVHALRKESSCGLESMK